MDDRTLLSIRLKKLKSDLPEGRRKNILASISHISDLEIKTKIVDKLIGKAKITVLSYNIKGEGMCPVCTKEMSTAILHNNKGAWFCKGCSLTAPKSLMVT